MGVFFLLSSGGVAALPPDADNIISLNFDLDDNILNVDTQVVLFEETTGEELLISSKEWGRVRGDVGTPNCYPNYTVRNTPRDPIKGSFRHSDALDRNYFLMDLLRGLASRSLRLFGPEYFKYYHALAAPKTQPWVHIITSRGADPVYLYQGQIALKGRGFLKSVPQLENIHPISYPLGPTFGMNNRAAKIFEIKNILDGIQARPVTEKTEPILDQSGVDSRSLHYFEYSDDSKEYILAIRKALSEEIVQGRWPSVKIALIYTGPRISEIRDEKMIFLSNGEVRAMNEYEAREIAGIIGLDWTMTFSELGHTLLGVE